MKQAVAAISYVFFGGKWKALYVREARREASIASVEAAEYSRLTTAAAEDATAAGEAREAEVEEEAEAASEQDAAETFEAAEDEARAVAARDAAHAAEYEAEAAAEKAEEAIASAEAATAQEEAGADAAVAAADEVRVDEVEAVDAVTCWIPGFDVVAEAVGQAIALDLEISALAEAAEAAAAEAVAIADEADASAAAAAASEAEVQGEAESARATEAEATAEEDAAQAAEAEALSEQAAARAEEEEVAAQEEDEKAAAESDEARACKKKMKKALGKAARASFDALSIQATGLVSLPWLFVRSGSTTTFRHATAAASLVAAQLCAAHWLLGLVALCAGYAAGVALDCCRWTHKKVDVHGIAAWWLVEATFVGFLCVREFALSRPVLALVRLPKWLGLVPLMLACSKPTKLGLVDALLTIALTLLALPWWAAVVSDTRGLGVAVSRATTYSIVIGGIAALLQLAVYACVCWRHPVTSLVCAAATALRAALVAFAATLGVTVCSAIASLYFTHLPAALVLRFALECRLAAAAIAVAALRVAERPVIPNLNYAYLVT